MLQDCDASFNIIINMHGGVLLLVKLQALPSNFTKSNSPPWVFSRFLNCANGTTLGKVSHSSLVKHYQPEAYFGPREISTMELFKNKNFFIDI